MPTQTGKHRIKPGLPKTLWALLAMALCLMSLNLGAAPLRLQLRWLPQFQFAGYYMAQERGYYREAGLEVEILPGGPSTPNPIENLLAGKADFAISNSGLVIAHMAGKPVVALAALMQSSPSVWIVRADSDIYTPHDLAGKRVMVMPLPESAELRIMLMREGINLDQVQEQPTSFDPQDLLDGHTDAYNGYVSNEPFWLSQKKVPYRLLKPREYGVNFYNDVLSTHADLLRRNPDQVEAFLRASLRGWHYALEHIEESVQLIHQRHAPQKSLDHLRFEAEQLKQLIMPELVQLGHMNPGRWETIAHYYVELGLAQGSLDLDSFIYTRKSKTDNRLLYQIVAGAVFTLLVVTTIALRFAHLVARLRREIARRRVAEQQLLKSNQMLEELANTDRLTGQWTRRKFEEVALQAIARAERYGEPLSLIFLDLDHFKKINDQHGHDVGDKVLSALAQRLRSHLRKTDGLCRWGGEEFVILMPHTELGDACEIAEKLRSQTASTPLHEDLWVTASFGVSQWQPMQTLGQLVDSADRLLYRAKQGGRNRVECMSRPDAQAGEAESRI